MPAHPLVEQVQATLCRLADAPQAADAATSFIAEIEGMWERPFVLGIGGTLPARTELFNQLFEHKLFDPMGRAPGCAALRIRRGSATGFRATRDDGTHEEQTMPPDTRKEIKAAQVRAQAARGSLAERESAIERVDGTLPKRPPWWMVWLWPVYWIRMYFAKRQLADKTLAELALTEARQQVETIEQDAAGMEAHARLAQKRFTESLQSLAGGGPIGNRIVEVELTLAPSPLPENVEILELAGASRASAAVDAVFMAQGERLFAPVRGGHPLAIGENAKVIAGLPALLSDARALRIARRVQQKITSVIASLGDAIERKEATFRTRIDKIQGRRLDDPHGFARHQLERVRNDISASVHAVVEHSSVHLGSELAQLQNTWIGSIANAADGEALKAALAKIDDAWHSEPRRIVDEVRVLVMGGLGGSARDIYPAVVADLVAHGLPEEHARPLRVAPVLEPVVLLPSLMKDMAKVEKPGWLAGLFRSFEGRRTEIREKIHERLEHMREVAGAELLDAEPRLHHAIGTALANLLEVALQQQRDALNRALDAERQAIERDRETLAPLVRVHDAVRVEASRLSEMVAQLETAKPALAVAAAAAETASLSQ